MNKTRIEWTNTTVNPWVGCEPVSPGCANCYAKDKVEGRLKHLYPRGFHGLHMHLERLDKIPRKGKPRMIFPCSLSDPFYEKVNIGEICDLFNYIEDSHHIWQVLTKRPARMLDFYEWWGSWPDNAWAGVSVENADYLWRLDVLAQIPAGVRFVSLEPLLGPVDLRPWLPGWADGTTFENPKGVERYDLDWSPVNPLDWVTIGAESGPRRRPFQEKWARDVIADCRSAGVPVFYKQGHDDKGRLVKSPTLDGELIQEMPE